MDELLRWVFGLLVAGLLVTIGWRLLSRRWELPCPAAFIWMLEGRLMDSVAGPEAIITRARIGAGMRVLDAGCGPGRLSIPIARQVGAGGEVVALDVQQAMLERLKQRVRAAGVQNIRTVHGALGEGALHETGFDRAVMVTVLGEIPNRSAALGEVFQALKPGGMLSITEILPDPHYQSRKSVRELAERTGFRVEQVAGSWRWYTMNLTRPPAR